MIGFVNPAPGNSNYRPCSAIRPAVRQRGISSAHFPKERPSRFTSAAPRRVGRDQRTRISASKSSDSSAARKALSALPPVVVAFLLGIAVTAAFFLILPASAVYKTADDIPPNVIRNKQSINGLVVQVADGDTIRIQHQPALDLSGILGESTNSEPAGRGRPKLSDSTIVIRIAGVDAPETAHRGRPAQPFGNEAKMFVSETLLNKPVQIEVLSKDQYGRVVGIVRYGNWPFTQNLSSELLRRGLATVYRQGGAEYGGSLAEFESLELQAKEAKAGMWGLDELESPAEFKARMRKQ